MTASDSLIEELAMIMHDANKPKDGLGIRRFSKSYQLYMNNMAEVAIQFCKEHKDKL